MKKILVTGCVGFIGSCIVDILCQRGAEVIGIDNFNNYYDIRLKEYRLDKLKKHESFTFIREDIENKDVLDKLFSINKFDAVMNLAARAGVRSSLLDPHIYATTNIIGNLNLLEMCRKFNIRKYVLASTSSLYAGKELPFKETIPTTTPISPYAATKGAAEGMAYTYHYLYGLDVSILRYFTVYGPAGRPDMSIFRFIKWALEEKPIMMNGDGTQSRDFTYVSDIAEGTIESLMNVGYEIINLGSDNPYSLKDLISTVEGLIGKRLEIQHSDFQKEDMKATWADNSKAKNILGWMPKINFYDGIKKTYDWTLENWQMVKHINL